MGVEWSFKNREQVSFCCRNLVKCHFCYIGSPILIQGLQNVPAMIQDLQSHDFLVNEVVNVVVKVKEW